MFLRTMLAFIVICCTVYKRAHAYTIAEVVDLAKQVYDENFGHTVIGDCDFGGQHPADLCPRDMGNGCTMAQMFLGVPEECKGVIDIIRGPPRSYDEIWKMAYSSIVAMRANAYRMGSNEGILEAGQKALTVAQRKAKTEGKPYGVGVCTTLAAAGQTAIAEKMNADLEKWAGARIKFMREPYLYDGHEYLIVTDRDNANDVLVDYWYSALDGNTNGNIGSVAELRGQPRWDLTKAVVAVDGQAATPRIYVVGQ